MTNDCYECTARFSLGRTVLWDGHYPFNTFGRGRLLLTWGKNVAIVACSAGIGTPQRKQPSSNHSPEEKNFITKPVQLRMKRKRTLYALALVTRKHRSGKTILAK
ncbi:hypothetical protein JTE90_011024 [Oedothorax gibbosus]|uniref:Uncharacterized protein n=1 Tax=Oedothorax gibbosus TaxID=931172 RepID=A0AAV6VEJ2_9ARAC|nr:hypothetical protein JTE90_011024 [Oedothorax gibbosus]